ncbi:GntR family transcriptional regulator [Streptomyces sp.]|uniref:GntR family transcriptional regulator n=1 Tax=Streptomyces sp. TaxID=1931 RepID=UPI002F41E2D1
MDHVGPGRGTAATAPGDPAGSVPAPRWHLLAPASRRQQVVDLLRDEIITGRVAAGEQLKQDHLCAALGVSPGPVREALRQLESEGLVEHFPNRGVFVTQVRTDEFINLLLPVRLAIETYAVPLAAERMTPERLDQLEGLVLTMERHADEGDLRAINEADVRFHELTVEACGSTHSLQLWHSVLPRIRAQIFRLAPRHRDLHEIAREHRDLLEALTHASPDDLRAAIEHHIVGTATELLRSARAAGKENPADG